MLLISYFKLNRGKFLLSVRGFGVASALWLAWLIALSRAPALERGGWRLAWAEWVLLQVLVAD